MSLEVIIPAYKPDDMLIKIVDRLNMQDVKPDKITILLTVVSDSDSEVKKLGERIDKKLNEQPGDKLPIEILPVPASEFSHGGTRQLGMDRATCEYVLFMTQDAVPADKNLTANLIKALDKDGACMAYARQVPRKDADDIERFTRLYNYPKKSHSQTIEDLETKGIKAIFCSDSCCMYKKSVHDSLGGFDRTTQFNEDAIYAYKALNNGFTVEYCAEARVFHSHRLTLKQQFKRNRDLAVSQSEHSEVYGSIVSEKEGVKYVLTGIKYFARRKQYMNIVMLIITAAVRYAGFFVGKNSDRINDLFGRFK